MFAEPTKISVVQARLPLLAPALRATGVSSTIQEAIHKECQSPRHTMGQGKTSVL